MAVDYKKAAEKVNSRVAALEEAAGAEGASPEIKRNAKKIRAAAPRQILIEAMKVKK